MAKSSDGSASRKTGLPLHHQLYVVLRDQIMRGLYAPGALIPNEARLGELFSVSRITVRRAVADLHAEGLLEKQQGRGTFVRMQPAAQRPAATLGFVESLRRTALNTQVTVLDVQTQDPPAVIAVQLDLPAGHTAVHAVRLRSSNTQPLMITDAWVPDRFASNVTRAKLKKHAMYEILMAQGIEFGRVVQEITAEPANPQLATWLDVDVGSPMLRVTRLLYSVDRVPVMHITIHASPERSRILMDVPVASMNTLGAGQIAHDVPRR